MSEEIEDPIAELIRLAGPRPRVSDERMARVRAEVHEEWQRGLRKRTRVRRFSLAAVAAAAVIAIVLLVPRERVTPAAPPAIVAVVQAVHGTTNVAGKLTAGTLVETLAGSAVSLDWNGATLRLGEGTRVRLDSARAAMLERGSIYFDGHESGVVIRTKLGDVRDIGTRFEVRLSGETLRVRVREGRVDFRGEIAEAATELIADRDSVQKNAIAISGAEWKWIEDAAPPLRLEGLTLQDALARIAREKGLRLELRGVDGTVRLHGDVEFTTNEALDAATAATDVSYRIQHDTLVVSGRDR